MLCGVKDAGEYTEALREVPAAFLYPIVISLLLLLIVLPLIKLYTMGPSEAVRMVDLAGYLFSVLCGSMLVTLIIIQVILLYDANIRQAASLDLLSHQIEGNFRQELGQAYRQLEAIDRQRATDVSNWRPKETREQPDFFSIQPFDATDSLIGYMKRYRESPDAYFHFDRIAWVDRSGRQMVTASLESQRSPLYIDVSQRTYFTDFVNNACFRLPGIDTSLVSLQPVLSWSDGQFRVVLARRSSCAHTFIVSMSTNLYSVNEPVLPSGFGFCLIDEDGQVQVHSEPSRNLIENFFQQTPDAEQLKAAITGRQTLTLPMTKLYGKEYGLELRPVNGMPLYLVVFYDKGYILPVNMRILIFSLLGCASSLLLCGLIWLLSMRKRWEGAELLSGVMDDQQWMAPRRIYAGRYFSGWLLLLSYVVGLVLLAVLMNSYRPDSNHRVIVLLLLTPAVVRVGIWFLAGRPYGEDARSPRYLHYYSLLALVLVLALGVLPAALFTWYAHNQEILQSVKREQLLTAKLVEYRRQLLYRELQPIDSAVLPEHLLTQWQYQQGIYGIYGQRLSVSRKDSFTDEPSYGFEQQYFDIATQISNNYYDPEFMPVLQDHSIDSQWQWVKPPENGIVQLRYILSPDIHSAGRIVRGRTAVLAPPEKLIVESVTPRRYLVLEDPLKLGLLILLVGLLLVGIYRLIKRITAGLFLLNWVTGKDPPESLPLEAEYCRKKQVAGEQAKDLVAKMRAAIMTKPPDDDADRNAVERKMLERIRTWADYFAFVLKSCTPKEKLLLYNFSCTGFLNYKNGPSIDRLLEEGILVEDEGGFRLFSPAFRAYIRINVHGDDLEKGFVRKSSWQRFKIPFLVLLMAAAAFLFFTRQEAWQRVSALIAALSTSLGLLSGLFKEGAEKKPAAEPKRDAEPLSDGDS